MKSVPPRVVLATLLAAGALSTGAMAGEAGKWRPTSTTSVSITGPVVLSSDKISLSGHALGLREVGQPASFKTDQGDRPARVFRVLKPRTLKLVSGNTLCGEKPVTWIVAQPEPPDGLQLLTYDGPDEPTGQDTPELCGIFFYNR